MKAAYQKHCLCIIAAASEVGADVRKGCCLSSQQIGPDQQHFPCLVVNPLFTHSSNVCPPFYLNKMAAFEPHGVQKAPLLSVPSLLPSHSHLQKASALPNLDATFCSTSIRDPMCWNVLYREPRVLLVLFCSICFISRCTRSCTYGRQIPSSKPIGNL